MKRLITLLFIFSSWVAWAQTATVNLNQTKQYIRGFGGINHPVWAGDLTADQRTTAFGNGSGQIGMSILRIWVSDNQNDWSKELATAKRAIELGAIVFASPWNPPASMTEVVNGKKRLRYDMYDEYAAHLTSFCNYMKNNGVNIYAISIQNEPDYANEWTWWTTDEILRFLKENASSIPTRIIAPESFQYRKVMSDPILNDPAALANMDILGAHLYGTQLKDFPYPLFKQKGAGKELWMTEHYTESNNDADLWPLALDVAYEIHNSMVEAEFNAYVWWYIRRSYGMIKENSQVSKRGYCMAQYSKFIRPGYVRVDATKNPTTDVYISAYKKDDDVVVVAVNRSTSSKTITISVPGTKVTSWEKYVTSGSKNLAQETDINAPSGSFQIILDASSVTSFVGKAAPGIPSVSLTAPANKATFTTPATIDIAATASDPNGSISKVEFYNGTAKLGEDASSPYSYSWTNVAKGSYILTAVATDNSGNKVTSTPVTIKVNVPQGSYNGNIHQIPGIIQVEEYDLGGNGFAYFDDSPGSETGVAFRSDEDVDIEACTDAGGGYNLGYATMGEWLEYTVDVKAAGTYDLDLRVACNGDGRTLTVSMDGVNVANAIAIPNTTDWQTWTTTTVKNVSLKAGKQIMRITLGGADYINLNYVAFKAVNVSIPPTVSLTAPANNDSFTMLETVTLTATASDADGTVASVQFYDDTTLLGTDNTAPFSFDWSGMKPGSHTLTAVATDNKGITTTSAPISITITAVQAPYKLTKHTIPGRIEVEEYDLGGEGLGYHEADTNGNEGGANLRNDQVDIETTGDVDGNYNIAYIMQGEWLEYTVDVLTTDVYGLNLRVAADGDGKVFHIEMDGTDVSGSIAVPNTGGWQTWQTVSLNNINLTEGAHVMRIAFDSDYMNLNYVEFTGVITGINGSQLSATEVFPNPFTENGIHVRISGDFQYKITDLEGALVQSGHGRGNKIVGENLEPGIYFLSIQRNNEIIIKKIVRQ